MTRKHRYFSNFAYDERGTVVIGFLLLLVPIYLSIAALWNTSVLVEHKIQAQAIADAAAHTVASDTAATLNEMAMLNMLILRAQSAQTIYAACVAASAAGVGDLVAQGVRAVAEIAFPPTNAIGAARATATASDVARLGRFVLYYLKTNISGINKTINKCNDRQNYLYKHFGSTIEMHLDDISEKINQNDTEGEWKIYATMKKDSLYPGGSSKAPFLAHTSTGNKVLLLAARLGSQDQQWIKVSDPSPLFKLPKPKKSSLIKPPAFPTSFPFFDNFATDRAAPAVSPPPPGVGKVMKYTWLITIGASGGISSLHEWGYNINNKKPSLQTLVFVERTEANTSFMAKGFFKPFAENTVLAASQAEASNIFKELMTKIDIPVLKQLLKFIDKLNVPWTMWTSLGINYQPRLTAIEPEMFKATKNNPTMQQALEKNTGYIPQNIKAGVFLH